MLEVTLQDRTQEVRNIAEKAVKMSPKSLHTLIFATDILLARDQMENREQIAEERLKQNEDDHRRG